jgi:hypothetical protein
MGGDDTHIKNTFAKKININLQSIFSSRCAIAPHRFAGALAGNEPGSNVLRGEFEKKLLSSGLTE